MNNGSITLHVFFDESLLDSSISQFASGLLENFCIPVVSLGEGSALAINYTNTPVVEGMNQANLEDAGKVRAIFKTFSAGLKSVAPLPLRVPSSKYNIYAWLPKREISANRYIAMQRPPSVTTPQVWLVKFQLGRQPSAKLSETIHDVLSQWKEAMRAQSGIGEPFDAEQVRVIENDGVPMIECIHSVAITTFPWLDLYVRVRNEPLLKKAIRSIDFKWPTRTHQVLTLD